MPPKKRLSSWLLLTYKVPAEPSKFRVAVWRRIRSFGAVYVQSGLCALPKTAEHQRQLRMVQREIERAGGEAMIFETSTLDAKQETAIIARFKHERDQDYEEFLDKCADYMKDVEKEFKAEHFTFAELQENDEDLRKLKSWLGKIKALDYYAAPARVDADKQLAKCEELLESFANEVFEREQNAKPASKLRPVSKKGSRRP